MQQSFQTDNEPFVDTLRQRGTTDEIAQAAGDSGRLLLTTIWPDADTSAVARLRAAYSVIAGAGSDYHASSAGLTAWHDAYNALAADLSLPQLG